ncbi:MAG: hypothetical protein KGI98_11975 [Euryarchaeota archaeon]|nr:hypothetical protein [Euryarchaeota archaeon]MDE1881578.1 hypothetical protein [Euryarchaeota archaeon]
MISAPMPIAANGLPLLPCPQGHLAATPTDEPGILRCAACGWGFFTDMDELAEDPICQGHPGGKRCLTNEAHLALEVAEIRRAAAVMEEA